MKHFRIVLLIGLTEILIGGITLCVTLWAMILSLNTKSFNVLIFVTGTATVSTFIGIGILKFKKAAYQLLLYFSSVVLLSKILIFMDIIHLNGAMETSIPPFIKDGTSVLYHAFVIYYLQKEDIRKIFHI